MLALHRSGRRNEALRAFQQIRTAWVREFGLEPSAGLRRVRGMILEPGAHAACDQGGDAAPERRKHSN